MYFTIENVNRLSIPLGVVLGPGTIIYHLANLINDIATIAYYSFLNRNYKPSESYHMFKLADLQWEVQVSLHYKPTFNHDGTINQNVGLLSDRATNKIINDALELPLISCGLTMLYKELSEEDKWQVELENAKRDFFRQIYLIAIGAIRSIPLIGAATLCYFDTKVHQV